MYSPNIFPVIKSKRTRLVGHVAYTGGRRGVCSALVGIPDEKRLLRRPRIKEDDNIKMDVH